MATLRDDVARLGKRLRETVEQRTGMEVIPTQDRQLLESAQSEARVLRKTLRMAGWEVLNYEPGMPGAPGGFELKADQRRFAAKQALAAWIDDPLAGQMVDLYVSFVFGRGVPQPKAPDPDVQAHLEATWADNANMRCLTSFDRLIEKGVDLCIQSTVAFTLFDDGEDGMARMSLLCFDDLEEAIRHDELAAEGRGDRFRILYVKARERRVKFNFADGTRSNPTQPNDHSLTRTVYYEVWGAFDDEDPVMRVQDEDLRRAPEHLTRPGKVYLLTVNKTSEMAFGVPRMRRIVSWITAYNEMLGAIRDRMKAMASVYMKATVQGGQRDLEKLGQMMVNRASTFGGAQDLDVDEDGRYAAPRGPGVLGSNDSLSFEPWKIDSGAGDLQQIAPIMRGQVSGPWPDGYLSGDVQGTVAGSQSLELPTLAWVAREQETWRGPFRALGQASIDAAIKVGDLSEWRDPTAAELEQLAIAQETDEPPPFEMNDQGMVKRDLSFEIKMPSPLKRMMTDVVSAATSLATAIDPNGENPEVSRWLFATGLSEAFDEENVQTIVDQVLPRQAPPTAAEREAEMAEVEPGAIGPDGERHPADNPGGAPVKAPDPEDRKVQESAVAEDELDALLRSVREHMAPLRTLPQVDPGALAQANGNGHGA